MTLDTVLAAQRDSLVKEWLARTLRTYSQHASRFLLEDSDPFRNPVGHTLKEALGDLFDQLVGEFDLARVGPKVDEIVRIRAVQDFTASQAVAFVFLLKPVIRESLAGAPLSASDREQVEALNQRIDEMALVAFDCLMRCREQIYEIRANEARRRVYLLERAYPGLMESEPGLEPGSSEITIRRTHSKRGDGS